MGIDGAAIATSTAFASIAVMYVVWNVWTSTARGPGVWSGRQFDRALFLRLLRFGLPSGIQQFLEPSPAGPCSSNSSAGLAARIATSLVFNLNSMVFIPLLGLGTAVMALTGQRTGEGRPQLAMHTTWMAFGLASLYVALFCGIYLLTETILSPYGLGAEHETVHKLVVFLLRFVAVYSWCDAMTVVSAPRSAAPATPGLPCCSLPDLRHHASRAADHDCPALWLGRIRHGLVRRHCVHHRPRLRLSGEGAQGGRWKTMRVIEHTAADTALAKKARPLLRRDLVNGTRFNGRPKPMRFQLRPLRSGSRSCRP